MKLYPLFLLATGVTLNLVAQKITDFKFARPQTHLVAWVKFFSTFIFAGLIKFRVGPPTPPPTTRQQRLMFLIGALDAVAYVCFSAGFVSCGAVLSSLVLAAAGQVFTALATLFILKKKLSVGQIAAVALVCLGMAVRTAPPSLVDSLFRGQVPSTILPSIQPSDYKGVTLVLIAAILYSALGVAYEALVSTPGATPRYPDILWTISRIGFTSATTYQVVYVLPRWEALVARPLAASGVGVGRLCAWLAAFGGMFNLHLFTQSLVMKSEGALAVSLVNAMRGAVITVVAGVLFCSPEKQKLCVTMQSGIAAALTALAGIVWAVADGNKKHAVDYKHSKKVKVVKSKKEL